MKLFEIKYQLSFVDVVKRRLADRLLHNFEKQYASKYPNLAIFARDHVGIRVQCDGIYERPYLEMLTKWLNHNRDVYDGTVLDIGANIGNRSVYFSNYFMDVISFEPNPSTFQLLKYNASLSNNIQVYNFGISDCNQDALMSSMPGNAGGSYVDSKGDIPIKLVTADSIVDASKKVNLIKIDVEGHELQALKGCSQIISKNRPLIMFEQHVRDFKNGKSDVVEYLKGQGYVKFVYSLSGKSNISKFTKLKKLFNIIFGTYTETLEVCDDVAPGFYIFLVAIHNETVSKYIDLNK